MDGGSDSQPDAPSYFLSFSKSASDDVIKYVTEQFQARGLQCKLSSNKFMTITADMKALLKQAEEEDWMKQLKDSEEEVFKEMKFNVKSRQGFISALLDSKPPIFSEGFPLHSCKELHGLGSMLRYSFIPLHGINVDRLRNYFGETVAFYFAWMNFYSTCILAPALVGTVMYFLSGSDITVDTNAYLPLYSVFMTLWAILFLIFWQRRSAVHSFNWNTHSHSPFKEIHHKFHGSPATDPITGKQTLYYPYWKRRLWYLFSFMAMMPLFLGSVLVMTLSLNLNGFVRDKASPIYIPWLAQFAQPGRIFAADSPYHLWLIPTVLHSIVINVINNVYSGIASWCTDLENHKTVQQWYSSLVIKRVCFECADCFMPLFYIAFYQLDVITLRAGIVSLFLSDEIRRVIMECVLPTLGSFCKKKVTGGGRQCDHGDFFLSQYDQFDDYLEMVIQFGYITFFASAFQLGGLVTMVFIFIELRSDVFKLLHAYRRPFPLKCKHIGVWYDVMRVMGFVSILTNCAILGFSSEQLMQWLPALFTREHEGGDQAMALGSGRYVVGIVFGFEHLLLVVAVLLQWSINPVPKWVREAIARRRYLAEIKATEIQETKKKQ